MNQRIILMAEKYVEKILGADASGHDFLHCKRVQLIATKLSLNYECDKNLVSLSAILHDVDEEKVFGYTNHQHLYEFFKLYGVTEDYQCKITKIIDFLSFDKKDNSKSIETKIVQDADNLDALGAIGIARMFAFGGANGKVLFDGTSADSFSHFYLRLENLSSLMNTPYAKNEAKKRLRYMKDFMSQLKKEILLEG